MRAQGMNVEVGDAQRLTYHEKFDTIVLGEIIEHLENPGACLEGCRRALKPGGRIIISTPEYFLRHAHAHVLQEFRPRLQRRARRVVLPQTLRTMVERCGLRIESFRFVDDLAPDVVSDLPYRLFAYLWLGVRWIFPQRYRNTMVVVCVPAEKGDVVTAAAREMVSSVAPGSRISAHVSQAQSD